MVLLLLLAFLHNEFLQEPKNVSIFDSFVISFICIASLFSLFMYKNRVTNDTRLNEFNPPPSPPKLPIIGNLHQLGTRPNRSLQALSKKYGPIMLMHLGTTQTLVVSSAEVVKEMVKSHDIIFSNRPKITAAKLMLYDCQDIVFGNYGENWRQARKICAAQLLSLQRVQYFHSVVEDVVEGMIQKIRFSCANTNSNPMNVTEMINSGTMNIMSRCVFGKRSGIDDDVRNRFIELGKSMLKLSGSISFGDSVSWLGWIDVLTGLVPSMKRTFKEWDSCMDQIFEERIMSMNKVDNHDQDFVDILLQLQSDDQDSQRVMTRDILKAILLDLIVAGTETSSTSLEWMMARLMKHPTTMKKAQEEVRRVIGKKTKIETSDIDQMDYLKCVIKEIFRLNSPVPLLIPKETSSNVNLGGYDIKANTRVLVNAWAIHRDPKTWGDDAEEFIPERFENNPIDFKGQDFEYIPFGIGRRRCPGMSFGLAEVEYTAANLLYWFDWALPEGLSVDKLDMNEIYSTSSPRKVPLYLVPTVYSPEKMH